MELRMRDVQNGLLVVGMIFLCLSACRPEAKQQKTARTKPRLYADIFESNLSTYEKTNELRRRIASTINTGNIQNDSGDDYVEIPFDEFKPGHYLSILEKNQAVALCDLSSRLYVKILAENGIEAYTYNFGIEDMGETHVFSLVKIEEKPEKWIVQDPHYNYTITDSIGEPKDFFSLLKELKQGQLDNAKITEDTVYRELLVDLGKVDLSIAQTKECEYMLDKVNQFNDIAVIKMQISYRSIYNQPCLLINTPVRMENAMVAKGLKPDFFYAFILQITDVWGEDNAHIQQEIDKILKQ